ncbi:Molybdopterin synthase sulfur carrier subunit [Pandoraea iniqua]|uniref:Molybdopterin synthase sulfur carrier subunit n=1 Tax=Pandoraea iniqua TaxID=2508288 RepID=A0A5E4YF28_9BURK|nr:MoaD/ThiS family protein [Pandoraea iniqua]VVE47314.1 Molybdopterin synthase sulfur carrier subunit [Pandoraea iniqua]
MTPTIELLAFGGTREIVGAAQISFPLALTCTADHLLDTLCLHYPALAPRRQVLRLAVNGAYVGPDAQVSPGDEVALIPPVSGG